MATEKTDNDAKKTGSYIKEKFTVAMSRISHDEVVRAIAKVSSHKLKLPNEKHMLRLLQATFGQYNSGKNSYDNVNEFIVTELEKRTHVHDWIPVLKTFLVFHRFMHDGSAQINEQLQKNRRIFCGSYIKDLADSPDGAVQQRVIQQYSRYLEERLFAEHALGFRHRMESEEFTVCYCNDCDAATTIKRIEPLLQQLGALIDVEYADSVVSNEATLKVYENLVDDGKRLYVLLTDRIKAMLDGFEEVVAVAERKKIVEIYRRYHQTVIRLSDYFGKMREGNIHFGRTIPEIKPLPDSLLEKLELALLEAKRPPPEKEVLNLPPVEKLPEPKTQSKRHETGPVTTQPPPPAYTAPPSQEPPLRKAGNRMSDLFEPTPVTAPPVTAAPPALDLFAQLDSTHSTPTSTTAPDAFHRSSPQAQAPAPVAPRNDVLSDLFAAPPPPATQPAAPTYVAVKAPSGQTQTHTPAPAFDPFADPAPPPPAPPTTNSTGYVDFFAAPTTAQQKKPPADPVVDSELGRT